MNFEIEKGHYVNFDLYNNVAGNPDKVYETVDYIKGEKLPHPYIFVIDKSTEKIIQYPNIVLSEDGDLVLCKETRDKMESDDSVITMFDYEFLIVNDQYETYVGMNISKNSHDGNDHLPFIFTKTDKGYLMFHKYTCKPFYDYFFDDLRIISPLGYGSSSKNLPLMVTIKNGHSTIYIEDHEVKAWTKVKPIYETDKHIEDIEYTRHNNTSKANWISRHHQLIIRTDGNTEIFTIEGYNEVIRKEDFNDTIITPLNAHGEFLLVDTKDKQNYIVRVDKYGHHKASIISGVTGTEKIQLPKNMSYMNCLRASYDSNKTFICDEDTNTIYVLERHRKKENFMSLSKIELYNNPRKDNSDVDIDPWIAMRKDGDIWYLKYRIRIVTERDSRSSSENMVLLDKHYIGNINKRGIIQKIVIPEYIEIPAYQRRGNVYIKLPAIKEHNVFPVSSSDLRCSGLVVDAMATNINTILKGEIPFDDMHIEKYKNMNIDLINTIIKNERL